MDFMKKKEGEHKMSPLEQQAKLSVLGGMREDSDKDMLSNLKSMGKPAEMPGMEVAPDPVAELAEGKSAEELQMIIDQLMEKKSALEASPEVSDESEKIEL